MKKIAKKVCALVLVFGLLVVPVRQAVAWDFGWTGEQVETFSPWVSQALSVFGYDYAASIVSKWSPFIVSALKSIGMLAKMFSQDSAEAARALESTR